MDKYKLMDLIYDKLADNDEREDLNMAVVDAYDEYLQATEKRGVSYGELAYIEGLSDKQARDMLEKCYQELNKIEENELVA